MTSMMDRRKDWDCNEHSAFDASGLGLRFFVIRKRSLYKIRVGDRDSDSL